MGVRIVLLTLLSSVWFGQPLTLLRLQTDARVDPSRSGQAAALEAASREVAVAAVAQKQALQSAKDASTEQQTSVASHAVGHTQQSYDRVKPMAPQARAQLLLVHKYAAEAQQHAQHAMEVFDGSRHIADAAAQKAVDATKGWISADASAAASHASKMVAGRVNQLAGAVGKAAEPYHLSLLRNQKFCAETYEKAKAAHSSAVKLVADSKSVASKAQEMQASGMGIEAQQTWGVASGMIKEADTLRKLGLKLYEQASSACTHSGDYAHMEQQAAANAASTTAPNIES